MAPLSWRFISIEKTKEEVSAPLLSHTHTHTHTPLVIMTNTLCYWRGWLCVYHSYCGEHHYVWLNRLQRQHIAHFLLRSLQWVSFSVSSRSARPLLPARHFRNTPNEVIHRVLCISRELFQFFPPLLCLFSHMNAARPRVALSGAWFASESAMHQRLSLTSDSSK